MAEPVITSSDPVGGATDVFVNISLKVTFAAALDVDTVNDTNVILVNQAANESMFAHVAYESSTNTVIITPNGPLPEDTVCIIKFPGTDLAVSEDFVIKDAASGDALTVTVQIPFTTGSRVWIDDSSIDKDSVDLSLEGDLILPVHVKALGDFALSGTVPKNHKADVSVDLDGSNRIVLTFTKDLDSGTCSSDWVDIDVYPILDDVQYLAQSGTFGEGSIPSLASVTCSGSELYIQFDGSMPNNVGIEIQLDENVAATDGAEYGPSDYVLSFTVDRYPKISGIHMVKRELRAVADELNDEYIAGLLFSNTIQLTNFTSVTYDSPEWVQSKWVLYKTLIDILDDQELEKALVAGTRRQLGDLNVSIDAVIGRLSIKHARLVRALQNSERALFGADALAKRYSESSIMGYTPDRLWHGVAGQLVDKKWQYYQGNHPAANTSINRKAKVDPHDYWV